LASAGFVASQTAIITAHSALWPFMIGSVTTCPSDFCFLRFFCEFDDFDDGVFCKWKVGDQMGIWHGRRITRTPFGGRASDPSADVLPVCFNVLLCSFSDMMVRFLGVNTNLRPQKAVTYLVADKLTLQQPNKAEFKTKQTMAPLAIAMNGSNCTQAARQKGCPRLSRRQSN